MEDLKSLVNNILVKLDEANKEIELILKIFIEQNKQPILPSRLFVIVFFRSHKSHLINHIYIKAYPNSVTILASDGTEVPIARRKKEEFKLWYKGDQS